MQRERERERERERDKEGDILKIVGERVREGREGGRIDRDTRS